MKKILKFVLFIILIYILIWVLKYIGCKFELFGLEPCIWNIKENFFPFIRCVCVG